MMVRPPAQLSSLPIQDQKKLAIRQFEAGICLIKNSGLLKFDPADCTFSAGSQNDFESKVRALDENFGRVMLWVWFSTGAEYLLKGFLILQDPQFLKEDVKPMPLLPMGERQGDWAEKIITHQTRKTVQNIFSTMAAAEGLKDRLVVPIVGGVTPLPERAKEIEAIYSILRSAIRNRDSHAYVQDVRLAHWHMVSDFGPAFNDVLAAAGAKYLLGEGKNAHSAVFGCSNAG